MKTRISPAEDWSRPSAGPTPPASDSPDLAAATQRGIEDAAAGRVVPHARVKAWLMRLRDGHTEPPPKSGK